MADPSTSAELPTHAPGWKTRRGYAGQLARPYALTVPPHVGGLCETGWHGDCPQAPVATPVAGCCSCTCHQEA